MTDSKEPDHTGEVIAEDVAKRAQSNSLAIKTPEVLAVVTLGGYFSSEELGDIDVQLDMQAVEQIQQEVVLSDSDEHIELIDIKAFNELRQQLADVSNELDKLLAQRNKALEKIADLILEDTSLTLQLRLNASEARNDELEKVARRYKWISKTTAYQFKKIQDGSITDGGDELYFHADRFDALVDSALAQSAPATDEQGVRP